jgi:hypothetical protein
MGYLRPVTSFNTGKQGEFHERTVFEVAPAVTAAAVSTAPEYAAVV